MLADEVLRSLDTPRGKEAFRAKLPEALAASLPTRDHPTMGVTEPDPTDVAGRRKWAWNVRDGPLGERAVSQMIEQL